MYFYIINVLEFPDSELIYDFISSSLVSTVIPTPRFVFSPGLRIHMFFWFLVYWHYYNYTLVSFSQFYSLILYRECRSCSIILFCFCICIFLSNYSSIIIFWSSFLTSGTSGKKDVFCLRDYYGVSFSVGESPSESYSLPPSLSLTDRELLNFCSFFEITFISFRSPFYFFSNSFSSFAACAF